MVKDPQSLHVDLLGAGGPDVDVDHGVTWPAKKKDALAQTTRVAL